MSSPRRRAPRYRGVVIAALAAVLVVAMGLSTRWLTPEEAEAVNPPPFEATAFVEEKFPEQVELLTDQATDVAELAPAISDDLPGAAAEHGVDLGGGAYAFPLTATGTVTEADESFAVLDVPGLAPKYEVRIALGAAVNGNPVRDASGTMQFGDFPDQTSFQAVANELRTTISQDVLADVDAGALEGKDVTVYGAWGTGGPADSYVIQPVAIEVAP
ncbi:hypothetical protein GCM10028784_17540 [Myceligenerans cantabricum]